MKKTANHFLVVMLFLFVGPMIGFAQVVDDDEPCKLMLRNGLYRTFTITRTASFEQDLKAYLSSETFKSDFKNNKWAGGIDVVVPVEGVPVPIGLKAGASDAQIDTFRQRVSQASQLRVAQSFYDLALVSIPDAELAAEYTRCLVATRRFGLKPSVDIGENEVTFSFSYTQQFQADPMPTVTNFSVINGTVLTGNIPVGTQLQNSNTVIVRRQPDKDMVFVLETNKGSYSRRIPGASAGFNKDLPLGTIIASYLDFDQFSAATSNNLNSPGGLWTAQFSKWAPADGRPVPNSKLQLIANSNTVPDLRGAFLRGLNRFDVKETSAVAENRKDPAGNRIRGEFQDSMFGRHTHTVDDPGHIHVPEQDHWFLLWHPVKPGTGHAVKGFQYNGLDVPLLPGTARAKTGISLQPNGEDETRPKNVAIYYYIRIN